MTDGNDAVRLMATTCLVTAFDVAMVRWLCSRRRRRDAAAPSDDAVTALGHRWNDLLYGVLAMVALVVVNGAGLFVAFMLVVVKTCGFAGGPCS